LRGSAIAVKLVFSRYHCAVPRDDADDLYPLLERLGNLLRHDLRAAGADDDLEPVHLQALDYLARANRYSDTPVGVAEYLGLTKGNVSQRLIALERAGLLRREADPHDGRVSHLVPTAAGRARLRAAVPPWPWGAALDGVPAATRTALAEGLRTLLSALQRERGGRSFGVCHTCVHFRRSPAGAQCGLTGEPLAAAQTLRICREHAEAD
jgi:DNA-binding MarR family transcriptional regulator